MNNKCLRCGNMIMNGQNFCTGCGMPVNNIVSSNPGVGKLILSREKNLYGFAVNLTVLINGCYYFLGNGYRLELDLLPGTYNITWKFWCRRDKSIQLNVMAGGIYCVDFRPDYFWGGFKLSNRCKFN